MHIFVLCGHWCVSYISRYNTYDTSRLASRLAMLSMFPWQKWPSLYIRTRRDDLQSLGPYQGVSSSRWTSFGIGGLARSKTIHCTAFQNHHFRSWTTSMRSIFLTPGERKGEPHSNFPADSSRGGPCRQNHGPLLGESLCIYGQSMVHEWLMICG